MAQRRNENNRAFTGAAARTNHAQNQKAITQDQHTHTPHGSSKEEPVFKEEYAVIDIGPLGGYVPVLVNEKIKFVL